MSEAVTASNELQKLADRSPLSSGKAVTPSEELPDPHAVALADALRLVAGRYTGERGLFAYEAFEFINHRFFANRLPWPLIVWGLTAHGRCLGLTHSAADTARPPVVTLHPSVLRGTEKANPWGVPPELLGRCYAFDVLLHECIHIQVAYVLGGWQGTGSSSHNNQHWVAEVNRIAPLLGLGGVRADVNRLRRVRTDDGGPKKSAVRRVCEGNVPFAVAAGFPYAMRLHLNRTEFYRGDELPFPSRWKV